MIILISLFAIGVILWVIAFKSDSDLFAFWGLLALVVFCCSIAIIPLCRMGDNSYIQGYYATKTTIEKAREKENFIETAALTKEILAINTRLAKVKYWNDTVFDIWTKDEYAELEFLE